jgi:hypothetical protein
MIAQKDVEVTVGYGLGAQCVGNFNRQSLGGLSVRNIIQRTIAVPQPNPPSKRTAVVLQDVLQGNRILDVELSHPNDEMAQGTPINLDDVLVADQDDSSHSEEEQDITLRVSEPYKGGAVARVEDLHASSM